MQCKISLPLTFLLSVALISVAGAQENHLIAGAGPSTAITKAFFAEFSQHPACSDVRFSIMDASVKHFGAIKHTDTQLFGRSGRPLNEAEKALGKQEILLGKIPAAFARGMEVEVSRLSMEQVEKIFTRQITNWQEVGGKEQPIVLAGREKKESIFSELRENYPFFEQVTFDQVFKKDDEMVQFILSPLGRNAIGFGVSSQFSDKNQLEVADFTTGIRVGLVYDQRNENHPLVQAARDFSRTPQWQARVVREGYIPIQ